MPDPETLTLPLQTVERAIALGERHAASVDAVGDKVDAYHRDIKPVVEQFRIEMAARAQARADADAAKTEGKSLLLKFFIHPITVAVLSVIGTAFATYLLGSRGIAPPAIKAALTEEAPHAAASH
jgi:hypothetical protein